jgi:multicomponent Na+:H+ antiporter subunit C
MSESMLFSTLAVLLFGFGLWRYLASEDPFRNVLSLNVMSSGVFLFLVSIAYRRDGPPDPVPHAMVLTGIVVAVSATALALILIRHRKPEPHEEAGGPPTAQ